LPATGREMLSGPELMVLTIHGLELPVRRYRFGPDGSSLHVYHCRWESGATPGSFVQWESSAFNLVRGIWAGRGNQGHSRFEPQNPEHLLSRPAATLSSIRNGGEGRGEEALRFMGRGGARENNTRKHPPQFPRHETLDGVEIRRLWATGFGRRGFLGKLADYGSFYSSLLLALFLTRKSPDLILSLTTPPYLGLLGKLAAKRHGCRHADWVMDLYPDVMFAHGMARKDGFLFRGLEKLSRFQLRGRPASHRARADHGAARFQLRQSCPLSLTRHLAAAVE
jgi:hypothetical protein